MPELAPGAAKAGTTAGLTTGAPEGSASWSPPRPPRPTGFTAPLRPRLTGTRNSLRRRAAVVVSVALALLVIGGVLAAFGLVSARQGRDRLITQLDPAISNAADYLTALVNQETGVRGYALTGHASFLQPYEQGIRDETLARNALARELNGFPALQGDLAGVNHRSDVWVRTDVTPLIGITRSGGRPSLTFLSVSKANFDTIRAAFVRFDARLVAAHNSAQRAFDDAYWILVAVVVAVFAGVALLLTVVAMTLRQAVIWPLLAVGADSQRVTGGELDRPVEATGPDEIADLARDIEAMRSRIVDDLHAIDSARAELASQGEELRRSNRDLEQFAYVASHDLQEPLRKVASFCQLLRDRYRDQLDERGVQYIDFAVDGAKRMQALVNDLLSFSRVGRTTEHFSAVDLNRALAHAEENLEGRMREAKATVVVGTPLPTVRGDATLLAALWQNLIGNAVKFRSERSARVEVSWRREDDGWRFWVRDNGIGIEPQYAERVFTIFQRLHSRDRYEGTGIGLALCRKIVEFHGGRISLESEDRPGTTLTFTLPFDETPEEGSDG